MKKSNFDFLREWDSLTDDELIGIYSQKKAKILSQIVEALGTEEHKARPIGKNNFCTFVREMHGLLESGSGKLGAAMSKAYRYEYQGKVKSAIRVYRKFIASCPSAFYVAIAEKELARLISPEYKCPAEAAPEATREDIVRLSRLLNRARDLLGRSARQLADRHLNARENLMRVCEADRQICDILADIEKIAVDDRNIE